MLEICSGVKMANMMPMMTSIERNCGKIFSNDFHAFFKASFVFCLLFAKDTAKVAIAITYKAIVDVINPPV